MSVEPIAVRVERAAEITDLGRTEIYKAIKDRRLASVKVGKRRVIRFAALHSWLASLEQAAA